MPYPQVLQLMIPFGHYDKQYSNLTPAQIDSKTSNLTPSQIHSKTTSWSLLFQLVVVRDLFQ